MKGLIGGFQYGSSYFDLSGGNQTDRGLLTEGIWLEAGMIRESFIHAQTFQQAMSTLLLRMSEAVAGYWNLQLYYDEEAAGYRIIDLKFGQLAPDEFNPIDDGNSSNDPDDADGTFYKFNANSIGECTELNLDS